MKADKPLSVAARRLLRKRLKSVERYAHLAAYHSDDDVEHVHRLRVATRRSRAALEIFENLLPKRATRSMKKTLRRIRRAANDARDLDVLTERLRTLSVGKRKRLKSVAKETAKRRRAAQRPLLENDQHLQSIGFGKQVNQLVESVRWRADCREPTMEEAFALLITPLIDEFFSRHIDERLELESFHQMRIAAKKLRYALELFEGSLDPNVRARLMPLFVSVQERLGSINDRTNSLLEMEQWYRKADSKKRRRQLSQMIDNERQTILELCKSFLRWWTPKRSRKLKKRFKQLTN